MATGEKLFRGIFSFTSISITAILIIFPFNAVASTSLFNSNIDVSSHTGAATSSIPIGVPPGRNGIQPNLALTYNSYRGNGWIGMGWDIDMGAIQRSTKLGVDYDTFDFVAKGQELVPVNIDSNGNGSYRAKIERDFALYEFYHSTGWLMTTKNRTKFYYGQDTSSRQDDPNDPSRVFKWCLDKVVDANGNFMIVTYEKDQGQIYLKQIDYTGNEGSSTITLANSVTFHLESDRPDQTRMYNTKFEVVTAKRLKTIEVQSQSGLVRAYKLEYTNSSDTFQSLIARVQEFSSDATLDGSKTVTSGTALPAIQISWPSGTDGFTSDTVSTDVNGSGWTASYYPRYLADVNGDGNTDLVLIPDNEAIMYTFLANGDGSFSRSPVSTDVSGSGWTSSAYPRRFADVNGDGKTDLLLISQYEAIMCAFLANGDGSFSVSPVSTDVNGSGWTASYYPRYLADVNGDGNTDLVLIPDNEAIMYTFLANGDGSFSRSPVSTDVSGSGWTSSAYPRRFADVNGDGKTDLLLISQYEAIMCAFLANGDGSFSRSPVSTDVNGSGWTASYYPRYLADVNGDGNTDLVLIPDNEAIMYTFLANGDGSFSMSPVSTDVSGSGWTSSAYPRRFADVNGDGKTDLLLISQYEAIMCAFLANGDGSFSRSPVSTDVNGSGWTASYYPRYLADVNGDGNTDLVLIPDNEAIMYTFRSIFQPLRLTSIENSLGATITIEYNSSSQYNNTLLPFILHPASKITVDDGNGVVSQTTYSYAGGLFDYATREFRGFAKVTQTNPNGTKVETQFHQDEYYKGRQYQVDQKMPGDSGPLLSRTKFSWGKSDIGPPGDQSAFVKLIEKHSESYDSETVTVQENYQYNDTNGNLISMTTSGPDAESVTTSFLYENYGDWLWRKTRETVEGSLSGKVRESYYDYEAVTGNLLTKEFWLDTGPNPRIEMTYDEYGNQETVTDAGGNTTITEYDSATHTYPVKISYPQTNGVSHVVENEDWDYRFGKVKITKDENDNRTFFDYDEFGRLIQVDSPDGGQVTTEYYDDEFPRLVITRSLEDGSGSTIDNYQYFDGLGRQIQTIAFGEGGKSIVTRYYYDEMGRNDLVEGPFFATGIGFPIDPPDRYPWTQTTFDKRGRPNTVDNSNGEYGSVATIFSYSGLSTTVTDPDGGSKTEKKDYLGRVVQVIEHADDGNYDTNYVYNVAGDLLQVMDYYGNTTTINYDSMGRKLNMTDQDMGFWEYTYDENGNLQTQTDQKQQIVTFSYDELNRIEFKSYTSADPTINYSYDNLSIPNGRGRLYSVSNSQVTTTYNEYDEMGRAKSVSKTISGDGNAYTTQYIYDLSGKLKQTIYPDGYQVNHTFYPGTGLLEAVTGSDNVRYAHNTNYEPTGKIGLMEHGNGTYTRHTYDPESTRLKSIISSRSGPIIDLQNKAYQYTPAGNIKQVADTVKGIYYNYTYDKLHRLKTETNKGPYDPISYEYDALGNIMSKTVGSATMDYNYQGPRPHAVKTIRFNGTNYDYTYDDNGNMISGPDFTNPQQVAQRTISYNADNMPRSISHTKGGNTTTTDFIYDGSGVRAKKAVQGGSTTYYIGDHFEIKDAVATKFIFAGNLRVAKITGTGINYFHKDHLGSSSVISDNNGNAIETADYTPFGSLRDHTGTDASNYKFTDQEFDPSSGLYNYNARLYDPIIGRFISPDPFVQAPFDPQTLNRYSYVRNNPLIYVDPSGYGFFSKLFKKAKKFVKNAVKKVAKVVVSYVTKEVLTYALFSIFDIAVPGLGQAISLGIGILSNYIADKAVNTISGANQGGGGGPPMSGNAGGRSPSGYSGGGYTGPLFPAGVSPGGGYSAISGTTYDFVHGYSANVVSNGHVFHGAFYEAIGKIYSGVKWGKFFTGAGVFIGGAATAVGGIVLTGALLAGEEILALPTGGISLLFTVHSLSVGGTVIATGGTIAKIGIDMMWDSRKD